MNGRTRAEVYHFGPSQGLVRSTASAEETFPASILITFLEPLAGSPDELDIDAVEVVQGLDTVGMGEIEMDYGEDNRDDYDRLQLALTAAAVTFVRSVPNGCFRLHQSAIE